MEKHKHIQDIAITYLCNEYDLLENIQAFEIRVKQAKKNTIKLILNRCQCIHCIDACATIEDLKFYY